MKALSLPLQPMATLSTDPFPLDYAKQAEKERRVVLIRYRHHGGEITEEKVEIYHTTWSGHIRGWCRTRKCRYTFERDRILAWQILGERYEPVHNMERWSRLEGWTEWIWQLRDAIRKWWYRKYLRP